MSDDEYLDIPEFLRERENVKWDKENLGRDIGQEILDGIREIKAGGGKRYRLQPLSTKARNIVNKIKFIDNKKEVK